MNKPETITLKEGDFIRYTYRGQFEYCEYHADGTRTVFASQEMLIAWRQGRPIERLIYCDDEAYQAKARARREALRDKTKPVIQVVMRKSGMIPRRIVKA